MKVMFELNEVEALATIKEYAEKNGLTIDQMMDRAIKKIAININSKKEQIKNEQPVLLPNPKITKYVDKEEVQINDYLPQKLKFKYVLCKNGTIYCDQYNKHKELKISYDRDGQEPYIFLLKAGCPNRADISTLSKYSLRIGLEELYTKIYGPNNYLNVESNIMNKIKESQRIWKQKNGRN